MTSTLRATDITAVAVAAAAPTLSRVERWASINSGSYNLPGLATMASTLADAFSVLPGALALLPPDPVNALDAAGREISVGHGSNLHLTVRSDAPIQILLTGHMDTIFAVDHPFQHVARAADGATLHGPGVADMKGGLAIMLAALQAFETSAHAHRIGYEVIINADEEVGSTASASLIARAARAKQAALTYEPALDHEGRFASSRPGSGNFAIIVRGRSAHAGRNPQDGRNAVVAAADLAVRLAGSANPGISINPARIDGGGPNNVVPDHAILRVNLRPATPADEQNAHILLAREMDEIARRHEVEITMHGSFGRPPKSIDAGTLRLFDLLRRCGRDLGLPIDWQPSGGVCDGNNIAAAGIPVIDTMGARGGGIHSPAEYLVIDSLAERARLTTLLLLRLAEGEMS